MTDPTIDRPDTTGQGPNGSAVVLLGLALAAVAAGLFLVAVLAGGADAEMLLAPAALETPAAV